MNVPYKKHKDYDPLGDCGKGKCPICARNNAFFETAVKLDKKEFTSDGVSPFVGRFGYPNVNVGILAPPEQTEDSWLYDAPKYWSVNNYQIPKIVDFRSSLLNSRYNFNIKKRISYLETAQDIAMSSKPVDVEIKLKEKPKINLNLDSQMAPTGPNAKLQKAKITQNPKIHTKVYKVFDDTDLKAADAINYLYESNFDENFLTRILSVGTLGIGKNRKLVPTRWSITATDDTIGKNLIQKVKDFKEINNYQVYFDGYLGNYYLILMIPDVWSYELFESYIPENIEFNKPIRSTTDHEDVFGRKDYAHNTAGGYYTVRLGILEKLLKQKRQATTIALRFITDEYTMPLGVWVTRQATRKSVSSKPIKFSSKELMINYCKELIKKKFGWNLELMLKESKLLNSKQKKLTRFI